MDFKINVPNELKRTKFQGLDGLRGVAIIFVIISHITEHILGWNTHFLGQIGVNIFFVLSGFLITTLLVKEKLAFGKISLKNFYIRRCLRIVPVVYLYLVILLILKGIYYLRVSGISFIASFLFLKNVPLSNARDSYTSHFWTLGVEEQFYLYFPILIAFFNWRQLKVVIGICIIVFSCLAFVYFKGFDLNFFNFGRFAHITLGVLANLFGKGTALILIGVMVSFLFLTDNHIVKRIYSGSGYFLSFIFFCLAIGIASFEFYPGIIDAVFGVMIAMVIILNLKQSFLSQILELEFFKKTGILSYSLYVWQQLFTYRRPWSYDSIIVNMILLVIVSFTSYFLYERRFLKYKVKFKKV